MNFSSVKNFLFSVFLFGLSLSSALSAETTCRWLQQYGSGIAMPDLGTLYVNYNTTLAADSAFVLAAPSLPTVSYFGITVYIEGAPLAKLTDYEIVTDNKIRPFPSPGALASNALGSVSPYGIQIGGIKRYTNYISIPASAVGKQMEIILRFYSPISNALVPTLRAIDPYSGAAINCPNWEFFSINNGTNSQPFPETLDASGAQITFVHAGGAGLYPDSDGYLAALVPSSGISFMAFPAPPYPSCASTGCKLDRRGKPGYSSISVSTTLTTTTSSLADRSMVKSSDGYVYLATLNPILGSNTAVVNALAQNGFTVLDSPAIGSAYLVYRQKVIPTNYVDSINKVPFIPLSMPTNPQDFAAPAFIRAAPVGTYCPSSISLANCIRNAKIRLISLAACYSKLRSGIKVTCN